MVGVVVCEKRLGGEAEELELFFGEFSLANHGPGVVRPTLPTLPTHPVSAKRSIGPRTDAR
jgi:hypothetical protein